MADNAHGYDLDLSLGFIMGTTYRKMSAFFQNGLKEYGITPEQWSVLYQIDKEEGLMQKEIAERSGKDRPTTTRILDLLEDKGLIYKQVGDNDRRSFHVYINDKGRSLIRDTIPVERMSATEVKKCISDDEYESLMKLLKIINRHLDKIVVDRE
ncbi:MarR family transcriptional regulator [Cohnella endophytica]|uniref:MarR family transcriptional regulator n=1 Tax=Cohnella endophytica TaxID=2419778 RepID=A0A494X247_9BACL|nr:MarR family transcriptional regulator [Cohnella endophytica]RKP44808.1 MarR family transcriptional regulator [Cohnella endophytica]